MKTIFICINIGYQSNGVSNMANKTRPNFLDQYHDRIYSLIAEGERLCNIAKIISQESNSTISYGRIADFCKRHGIDYQSRDPVRLVQKKSKKDFVGDVCIYCNNTVKNLDNHYLKCYRKTYHDYLLPFKNEIIELINQGIGLNSIPLLLSLDTTRNRIEGFCNRENIEYKGKWDARKQLQKIFAEKGNPSTQDDVKLKKENMSYLKYGVSNVRKAPEIIKKMQETKLLKYGKLNFGCKGRLSKPHQEASNILTLLNIEHFNEHPLLRGEDLKYRPIPDIFIPDLNLVIEIYGDYWHANPTQHNPLDVFYRYEGRQTAQEIWDKDRERIEIFTNLGYNVEIVWESEVCDVRINEILSNYWN